MKNIFNRTLSVLCAVMLLISVVSAWAAAEEEAASPTDLKPVEGETAAEPAKEDINPEEPAPEPQAEPKQVPKQEPEAKLVTDPVQEPTGEPTGEPAGEPDGEPDGEPEEDGIDSVEVMITKTLTVGQSWDGKMKKTKPAVLKLDVTRLGTVYMLVEGKDVWATVEKSDRLTENPNRTQTNPETDRMVISWEAEEGSYLITLGPVEPNILAKATVSFMNQTAYDAWEAEQAEKEPEAEEEPETEPEAEKEPETEPAEEKIKPEEQDEEPVPDTEQPENGEPEENRPKSEENSKNEQKIPDESEDRYVDVNLTWDVAYPILGDTAHLSATLYGYEGYEYTLQWQSSPDKETWTDVPEATGLSLDVVMTEENNYYYWRLVVYLEDDRKDEA